MIVRLKPLLVNEELKQGNYHLLQSAYLKQCLGIELYLPQIKHNPFVFSCFALSVDGRLCYPDKPTCYAITEDNRTCLAQERHTDYWWLLLGRTISDAVIIGRNSLLNEQHSFIANIGNPQLQQLRMELHKPKQLVHILATRDPTQIDFSREPVCTDASIPAIIYIPHKPQAATYCGFEIVSLDEIIDLNGKYIVYDDGAFNWRRLLAKLAGLGINTILNESPYMHHHLQEEQLLHEAWINTSGVYIGGAVAALGSRNQAFTSSNHPEYTILSLHHVANNFLYTRYRVGY